MERKEGFIDLDKILKDKGIDTTSVEKIIQSPLVRLVDNSKKVILIELDNELYYFKYNKNISPYNELVVNEIAHDFQIPTVEYDLAILNGKKGVLSKSFRKKDSQYITGKKLLEDFDYDAFFGTNNLEDIWDALEYRYQNYPNKREIIEKLMNSVVNMFVFDIIMCQSDRHALNWEIEENEKHIDIAPIYDNERMLIKYNEKPHLSLLVDGSTYRLIQNLQSFNRVSEERFSNLVKEKLWIISEENLKSVFERIENKTNYYMPEDLKEYYLEEYRKHRNLLENILGNDENIRKR